MRTKAKLRQEIELLEADLAYAERDKYELEQGVRTMMQDILNLMAEVLAKSGIPAPNDDYIYGPEFEEMGT